MNFKNFSSKKDSSHPEIVSTLSAFGWYIQDVSIVPNFGDLLIEKKHDVWLVEAKGTWTHMKVSQLLGFIEYPGKKVFLRTVDEVHLFHKFREEFVYAITNDKQNFHLKKLAEKYKSADKKTVPIREVLEIIEREK